MYELSNPKLQIPKFPLLYHFFEFILSSKTCTVLVKLVSPINYINILLILGDICWTLHSDYFLNSPSVEFYFYNFLVLLMNWIVLGYFYHVATRWKQLLKRLLKVPLLHTLRRVRWLSFHRNHSLFF